MAQATITALLDSNDGSPDISPELSGVRLAQLFQLADPLVNLQNGLRSKSLNHFLSRREAFLLVESHSQNCQLYHGGRSLPH
jgi:hypothetical protein